MGKGAYHWKVNGVVACQAPETAPLAWIKAAHAAGVSPICEVQTYAAAVAVTNAFRAYDPSAQVEIVEGGCRGRDDDSWRYQDEPDGQYRRADDWPVQRDILMAAVPEYYSEAEALYPGMLPPKTEQVDDLWRNRTSVENAVWLIEQLKQRIEQQATGIEMMQHMAAGAASGDAWEGNERRRRERRGGLPDRRQRDYQPEWERLPDE